MCYLLRNRKLSLIIEQKVISYDTLIKSKGFLCLKETMPRFIYICTQNYGEEYILIKRNTLMMFFRLVNNLAKSALKGPKKDEIFEIIPKAELKKFILECIFNSDEMLSNQKLFKSSRKALNYININT